MNPTTNRVYVYGPGPRGDRVLVVADGRDNSTTVGQLGIDGASIAVDAAANRLYVPGFSFPQGARVIGIVDGNDNSVRTISTHLDAWGIAASAAANRVYMVAWREPADGQPATWPRIMTLEADDSLTTIVELESAAATHPRAGPWLPICVNERGDRLFVAAIGPVRDGMNPLVVAVVDPAAGSVTTVDLGITSQRNGEPIGIAAAANIVCVATTGPTGVLAIVTGLPLS